jgi:ubiquinone/menaquinone biosynthesis C-methylase UbiE
MQPANHNISSAYDEWAETYDSDENRTRDLAAHALRESHLQLQGKHVVEIGCGTGRNTVWLIEQAATLIALDFSEAMLARARKRIMNPHVRFIQHDVRNPWPLHDLSADVIISMLILEHVEYLEFVFAEAGRVLKQGGELFLCELHPMRQLTGGQAQFNNARTGEREKVTAFIHDVSEYVNTGLNAGLELKHLGEWRDEETAGGTPRLLSLKFQSQR